VIQFILAEQVKVAREAKVEIVQEMRGVVSPWKGNDFNRIPLSTQGIDQLPVI